MKSGMRAALQTLRSDRERLIAEAEEFRSARQSTSRSTSRLFAVGAALDAVVLVRNSNEPSPTSSADIESFGDDLSGNSPDLPTDFSEVITGLHGDPREVGDLLSGSALERALSRSGGGSFIPGENSAEATQAVLYGVRGAAGEYWVTEQLVAGTLPVPTGTDRVELVDFHQPGVDLSFYSGTEPVIAANVKISQNSSVVIRHLERYPEMGVVYASSDAAASASRAGYTVIGPNTATFDAHRGPVVIDIGRSSTDFDAEIWSTLNSAVDAGVTSASVSSIGAGELLTFAPWISIAMITARSAQRIRDGLPMNLVLREAGADGLTAGAGIGAGAAVSAIGASTPITAVTSFLVTVVTGSLRDTRARLARNGDADIDLRLAQTEKELAARRSRTTNQGAQS
jgi:hypothetical protein